MASMVHGASLLISLQLASRLLTFAANQLLLRFLTAPLLGLSAQLEVYYLSVLFFARESLRVAIQRQAVDDFSSCASPGAAGKPADAKKRGAEAAERRDAAAAHSQAVVNLGYLAIALGALVSLALGRLYLATAPAATLAAPYLAPALRLYGVAAVVELLSEPCFVLMQARLRFGTRAAAESAATFVRCAVILGSVVWASPGAGAGAGAASASGPDIGVLPFALGQLSYGVVLLLVYLVSGYRLASAGGFSLLPRPASSGGTAFPWSYFSRPTVGLAASMMAQSLVKHLLTQGDTFLVSLLSTPEVQGVYALVANYGGLLARLLFQPVEESCRSYFSRLLSSPAPQGTANGLPAKQKQQQTAKPSPAILEARHSLYVLLRLYALLSAAVLALGPPAASPLLALVAGRAWTSSGAGAALAAYCLYVPFLALNGLAEAFVASVISGADVHRQSAWMGAFSAAFAAAAFVLMRVLGLGATGLVAANAVNMLCRIVWSVVFIKAFFRRHGVAFELGEVLPGSSLATALATWALMRQLDVGDEADERPFRTLLKVAGSAVPFLLLMYVCKHIH